VGIRKLSKDEEVVKKHFLEQMDARTDKLRSAALWDLYYGPYDAEYYEDTHELENWPGYVSAIKELEDWADAHLCDVFYNTMTGEVSTNEPEAEEIDGELVEPEDWVKYERKSLYLIVFRELVSDGGMH
jgi:hypothetical protein